MPPHTLSPLPLGAVLLAGSLNAFAQTSATLPAVEVRDQAIADEAIASFSRSHVQIVEQMERLRVLPTQLAQRGKHEILSSTRNRQAGTVQLVFSALPSK